MTPRDFQRLAAADQAERSIDRPPDFRPPENPAWLPWWRKILRWIGL